MSCFWEDIDSKDIKKGAVDALNFTEAKAKSAFRLCSDKYNSLDDETKDAIKFGFCVFAIVLVIAGIFYVLGKKAGRRESFDATFEEWDG